MRLLGLIALYLFALGAKEIAVTLPAMLIALEIYRRRPAAERVRSEAPTYLALFGVLAVYVLVRWNVLGDVVGESAAAGLASLDTGGRLLTALSVWPEYLRLMVFPLDLVADYGPAVLIPTETPTLAVLLGAVLLAATVGGALVLRSEAPALGLGLAWFLIAVSPVSNLLVRADVLLAERTLYLPSVGFALVIAAVAARVSATGERKTVRAGFVVAIVCSALLMARTVARNPTWMDTFTALSTLAAEHPESWAAQQARARGLAEVGSTDAAAEAYELALELAPDHYGLMVDAAGFYHDIGRSGRAEALLVRAIERIPQHAGAFRVLAEQRLRRGEGQAAHRAALDGLRREGSARELWALVSESYVAKGDLEAAIRARRASIGAEVTRSGWRRLAELLDAVGRPDEADRARREAGAVPGEGRP